MHPRGKKITWNLKKEMATHSHILTWEIPWTEKPGGLQSMGPQRVRHNWLNNNKNLKFTRLGLQVTYSIYFLGEMSHH